jgi:hypothetical protein
VPDYDFKSLSPIDLETLVRDLLQEELGIRFESFKIGKDTGIDFRYSPSPDNAIIVQCKHYIESSFNGLYNDLKKRELPKVQKLKPERYILALSIGLTPLQKYKIVTLFNPFILKTGDVYGREDLNNLLGKFPKIEKYTFKLWLSSMSVFEDILHSKVKNISYDTLEKIRQDAKYYVQNKSFSEALSILDKHHFCIIAGIPGIGKTILAEMLCLYYINQGYEVIKISNDISDAWSMDHSVKRRIYYYDDFLGQTSLTEKLNKNEDQNLLDFLFTIRQSKSSKLILTTREYILNQARLIYEKIAREKFDGETCIVDLSKYTRINRAKILFNHIYFSELPEEYKRALLESKRYLTIIDHKNYNPRIVDLMTQFSRVACISPKDYYDSFITNLSNPLEIWRHAFEVQLSIRARNLLLVITIMPQEVFLEDLQKAFQVFHQDQSKKYNYSIAHYDFEYALKELEGNFILIERSRDKNVLRLHNPSIKDFLENYLLANESIIHDLLQSSIYYDQVNALWEANINVSAMKFRKTILKHPVELIAAIRRTINETTCLVGNVKDGVHRYKDRWNIVYEARAILVVNIASTIKSASTEELFKEILRAVEMRIERGTSDNEMLVRLLKEITRTKLLKWEEQQSFLENCKKLLLRCLGWFDDFESFCNFSDLFPNIISEEDKQYVVKEFESVAYGEWSYSSTEPDHYRDAAHAIDELSKKLSVDMTERVKDLKDLADEIEESAGYGEDDRDDEEWGGSSAGYCSDQDIDSIFRTL